MRLCNPDMLVVGLSPPRVAISTSLHLHTLLSTPTLAYSACHSLCGLVARMQLGQLVKLHAEICDSVSW